MNSEQSKSFTDVHVLRHQGNLYFRVYSDSHLPVSAAEALEQLETVYPDDLQPCTVKDIKIFVYQMMGGEN